MVIHASAANKYTPPAAAGDAVADYIDSAYSTATANSSSPGSRDQIPRLWQRQAVAVEGRRSGGLRGKKIPAGIQRC